MLLPPAIVLCCSKAGLAVIRALGANAVPVIGVWYGDTRMAASSRFVKDNCRSPHPDADASAFTDFLLSRAAEWPGGVLIPTDDASLLAVSKYKERLSGSYRVASEDWSVVRQLLEKLSTYELARQADVACPRVQKIESAEDAVAFAREVGFPCLIKPSIGHKFFARFRAKMLFIHSVDELRRCMSDLGGYGDELMLSEYIPGDDTAGANYNSFFAANNPLCEFTAEKVRLKPQRIGFPTVVKSRRNQEVIELGRKMLQAIGYRGFSCMEFKRDRRDGLYKLMEVNARHNFSGMLALKCGLNFPFLSYAAAIGAPLPTPSAEWSQGVYWIDEERDMKGLARSLRNSRAYLVPYLRKHVFATFAASDPLPSLQQAVEAARFMARRSMRTTGAASSGSGGAGGVGVKS